MLRILGMLELDKSCPAGPFVNRVILPVANSILFKPEFRVPTHKLPSSSTPIVKISLPLKVLGSLGSFRYILKLWPS